MTDFLIKTEPAMPLADHFEVAQSLEGLPVSQILWDHPEEYATRILVGGREFGYYPSSILTTLNDLHLEWQEVCDRHSHTLTLSGYTVLDVQFEGEVVRFFDPLDRASDVREPIGGELDAEMVEKAFYRAVASVWAQALSPGSEDRT